jgi:hypothetical protein
LALLEAVLKFTVQDASRDGPDQAGESHGIGRFPALNGPGGGAQDLPDQFRRRLGSEAPPKEECKTGGELCAQRLYAGGIVSSNVR